MRILVTGKSGFTGAYLADELTRRGHEVFDLAADLRDRDAVMAQIEQIRPEAVAHLAAQAFVAHGDLAEFYEVNTLGTNTLLEALKTLSPEVHAVLLASSAAIYGSFEGAIAETKVPQPGNHYAISKLAMEHVASLYSDALPMTIVRPFNYTGDGQREEFLVPKIVSHFRRKAPVIELGNIDVSREFGDVRRVAGLYADLLETPRPNVTVNICTGRPHRLRDLVEACNRLAGYEIEIRVNPAFVRANEINEMSGDDKLMRQILNPPEPIALEETLEWMLSAR
ncbi:MAG: GDP-mannose 4,6-dehydratase [Pseudomonadota bacterium]